VIKPYIIRLQQPLKTALPYLTEFFKFVIIQLVAYIKSFIILSRNIILFLSAVLKRYYGRKKVLDSISITINKNFSSGRISRCRLNIYD